MMTWNNPLVTTWDKLVELSQPVKFMTGQLERGSNGTDHWQVYLHFASPRAFTAIKKQFPLAHLEVAPISMRAIRYCRKEDTRVSETFFTYGTQPTGGSGKDQAANWDDWYESAKAGKFENIPAEIQIKHLGNLERIYRKYAIKVDQPDTRGIWVHGEPGVGKSHWTRITLAGDVYYPKPSNKWWDGFNGQKFVILEDVDHDTFKFLPNQLKIWADKWSFVAETKGGAVFPGNRWFVITSNYTLDELMRDHDPKLIKAIKRRFYEWEMISRTEMRDQDADIVPADSLAKEFNTDYYDPK